MGAILVGLKRVVTVLTGFGIGTAIPYSVSPDFATQFPKIAEPLGLIAVTTSVGLGLFKTLKEFFRKK